MEPKKISENEWEIPKSGGMKVAAKIFASEKLMQKIRQDRTLMQAANVAHLQGIQKFSYVMPDAHEGYGFPIGGVAAMSTEDGVISPGGIGYDINCGVRLLRTDWAAEEVMPKIKELLNELFNQVPSGVGRGGQTKLSKDEMLEMLAKGSRWSLQHGYGKQEDLDATEEYGYLKKAEPSFVSESAIARGRPQLGTLGAGNHFLEVQKVDEIYDEKTAAAFGIEKPGQVTVMVHCGSRGFGHQVASDYIKQMEKKYGFEKLPDRELVNAPFNSELGQRYFKAMCAGMNYAFANRQMIAHWMRASFRKVMGTDEGMKQVYDVCHNIAKVEKHNVNGEQMEVCVHRKGATRSFGPGREEVNEMYKGIGQPVFIPGSMSTASYVLVGTDEAEEISFSSTAHGAGRAMSRAEAIRSFRGEKVAAEMEKLSIFVKAASWKGIAEEAAPAYKDINEVVKVSNDIGLGKAVARLVPLGVVKG
ncbi:RtcB family protein [Candidatus Woesearchaeota archaeon]|nr:RtcB family protein [Candidatus Woesearchaeota archaeon]